MVYAYGEVLSCLHQVSELLSLFRFDQHHPVLLVLLVLVILNAEVVSVTGCSA